MGKIAIIIGAGPAGLTAAYELVTRTDIKPIIIEKTNDIGGLCKTVVHNGNRIDIGGHRFFFEIRCCNAMVAKYFAVAGVCIKR